MQGWASIPRKGRRAGGPEPEGAGARWEMKAAQGSGFGERASATYGLLHLTKGPDYPAHHVRPPVAAHLSEVCL